MPTRKARTAKVDELVGLIEEHTLAREMVPPEKLREPAIWKALSEKMPITAFMRNLGNMTRLGVLQYGTEEAQSAIRFLSDATTLERARVPPAAGLDGVVDVQERARAEGFALMDAHSAHRGRPGQGGGASVQERGADG